MTTINEGTQTVIKTRTVAAEEVQAVYLNIGTASDNPFNGTIVEVSKLATGTVSVNTPGTITSGSIAVTAGTVVNNGGTVAEVTNVLNGTIQNSGTTTGVGTVSGVAVVTTVTNLANGTIQSSGTATGVGVVSNLTQGSINVTAGTIGGKAASGAAAVANPVQIAGTDSGGTIYSPLITTTGAVGSIQNIGTIKEAGTVTGVGVLTTVTTVSNVTNGTMRVTAGTMNSGTLNAGTINTGTINEGTLSLITTVSNLTNGSIHVTAATVNTGTMNSGTLNAGTINAATINTGTIRDDGRPAVNILSFGTVFGGTGTVFAYATLVAAPGANTAVWVNDLSITNPYGTVEAGIGFGTHADGGSVLAKGILGTQTGMGIEKVYPKAVNGGITNQPLILYRGNVGTIYANVTYFTSA